MKRTMADLVDLGGSSVLSLRVRTQWDYAVYAFDWGPFPQPDLLDKWIFFGNNLAASVPHRDQFE